MSLKNKQHVTILNLIGDNEDKDVLKAKSLMKLEGIVQSSSLVNKKKARCFRIWQKALLDQYMDMLSSRMRHTKKSILNQRFLFMAKKIIVK